MATGVESDLKKVSTASESAGQSFSQFNSFMQSAVGGIALGALTQGLGATITAANTMQASMMGLSSVSSAFGTDAKAATDAARSLASDGLMSVSDAAAGLKNLLATGFSLPQAINLMDAFKNSAAFNRQATLSYGDAIRTTTEGIKNGNDILSDNAGATQNMSTMLKQAGISVTELGNAQQSASVRAAIYNGFLRDTAAFSGDAAKMSDTFAGEQSRMATVMNQTKAQMGTLIEGALGPLIAGITDYVGKNQNFVVALALGGAAAVAFGALLVGVIGTLSIAAAVLGGPITIAIMGVAAILGGVVFNMVKNFESQMGDMVSQFVGGTGDMKTIGGQNLDDTSKKAQDLADTLAGISKQVAQTNQDFDESLAEILQSHEDKIASLTAQINDEKDSFAKAQQQKTDDFNQSQADQLASHQQTVETIQRQIDEETAKGRFADQTRLADLQDSLSKENDSYDRSSAEKLATYNTDVANAQDADSQKLAGFTDQLNTETAFMQKHAADLQGIRASDALDEIQKLQQSHDRQLASLEDQKQKAIKAAGDTTSASLAAANSAALAADTSGFSKIGTAMGSNMGKALRDSFFGAWSDMVNGISKAVGDWAIDSAKNAASATGGGAAGIVSSLNKLKIPGFATGGIVPGSLGAPTLAVVHGGEVITPPGERFGGNANSVQGGVTINQTNHNYTSIDMAAANAELGWVLRNA